MKRLNTFNFWAPVVSIQLFIIAVSVYSYFTALSISKEHPPGPTAPPDNILGIVLVGTFTFLIPATVGMAILSYIFSRPRSPWVRAVLAIGIGLAILFGYS